MLRKTRLKPSPPDVVLCVHGTFAGSDRDRGRRWWQRGSWFWSRLAEKLPRAAQLPDDATVLFRWSGGNSERDRQQAAALLLVRLQRLEAQGRPYHLIGHSHGGSVIWGAICLACARRTVLHHLRSWSTVGTPFLKKRSLGVYSYGSLFNIVLAALLIVPCFTGALQLTAMVADALAGRDRCIITAANGSPILTAAQWPALTMLRTAGVAVEPRDQEIQIGSFQSDGGQSVAAYLLTTAEGLTIVAFVGLFFYAALHILALLGSPLLESWRLRQEERLERHAMQLYGDRWLGVCCSQDEALAGLQATLGLSVPLVARLSPRERVFFTDRLHLLGKPYHWLLLGMYNHLVQPWLDRLVRMHVVKTLQGNNRPGAKVTSVDPWPVENLHGMQYPPLPKWLDQQLIDRADRQARDIAPALRRMLLEAPLARGLDAIAPSLTGAELIHTSYFDHDEVVDLLALHVAWAQADRDQIVRLAEHAPGVAAWFGQFKASVGVRFSAAPEPGKTWDLHHERSAGEELPKFYQEIQDLVRSETRSRDRAA